MQPLVSVIIPTHNHAQFLSEAIESVLAQSYLNIELIVVNDGSADHTKEVVKRYGSKLIYIYQRNRGLSAARNTGIKASRGGFLAFLDADDIWLPSKIEDQMKAIVNLKSVGLITCGNYQINEEGGIKSQIVREKHPNKADLTKNLLFKNFVSGGSNALVRRECFEKVGLFDEKLRSAEDWDMWFRINKYYEIKCVNKPLVKVRVVSNSMCSPLNVEKMLYNELLVLNRVFSDEQFKRKALAKRKAYGQRYFCAAWACKESREISKFKKYLFQSFLLYPFAFFRKSYLALVLYAISKNVNIKN